MFYRFPRCDAVVGVQDEHASYQVLGVVGHVVPIFAIELEFSCDDLSKELLLAASHKWQVTRKQKVDDATDAPHVGLLVIGFSHQDLGSYEEGSTALLGERLGSVNACCEPEIGQLDERVVIFGHEQEILGFHIAVGDLALMTVGHGLEHLDNEIAGIGFTVRLLFTDAIKEISSTHEFHDDKVAILFIKEVDQRNNVGMIQTCKNRHFVVNGRIVGWRQILSQDALDGDLASCCAMRPTTNRCKGPRLELR